VSGFKGLLYFIKLIIATVD